MISAIRHSARKAKLFYQNYIEWPTPKWRLWRHARLDFQGMPLHFHLTDIPGLKAIARGSYEPGVGQVMRSSIRPGSTVIEVGAHIGLYTTFMAKLTGPEGVVHAFEPDPTSHRSLLHNLQINNIRNVVTSPFACADQRTTMTLSANGFGESNSTIGQLPDRIAAKSRTVIETITLDEYTQSGQITPDLVKIDVEGAESLVITGGSETLSRSPAVVLEFHPTKLARDFSCSREDFVNQLQTLNKTIYLLSDDRKPTCLSVKDLRELQLRTCQLLLV